MLSVALSLYIVLAVILVYIYLKIKKDMDPDTLKDKSPFRTIYRNQMNINFICLELCLICKVVYALTCVAHLGGVFDDNEVPIPLVMFMYNLSMIFLGGPYALDLY